MDGTFIEGWELLEGKTDCQNWNPLEGKEDCKFYNEPDVRNAEHDSPSLILQRSWHSFKWDAKWKDENAEFPPEYLQNP